MRRSGKRRVGDKRLVIPCSAKNTYMNKEANNKDDRENRRRLASSIRKLMAESVACDARDDMFADITEKIETFTKTLAGYERRIRAFKKFTKDSVKREGRRITYSDMEDLSPVDGRANPISPPINVYEGDNASAEGDVTFPESFEGPPGLVHGGFVAAVFDEFLGITQSCAGMPGLTGSLTVRFRSPCPLNILLRLEGNVTAVEEGRKIVKGTMYSGDTVIADAEAVFIIIKPEQFNGFAE